MAAAADELMEVGFERASIDAIAERSGVARSTIYRNWEDRNALLSEAFNAARADPDGGPDVVAAETLAGDLENLGRHLIRKLQSDSWNRTVPSLISSATHNDALVELLADFSAERAHESRSILERENQRGADLDSETFDRAMERFVSPFFMRRLVSRRSLDDEFLNAQVNATLAELGVRP